MEKSLTRVAFLYDFDDTLCRESMQNYGLFPALNITPDEFWAKKNKLAIEQNIENNNAYLYQVLREAKEKGIHLNREFFHKCADGIEYFDGLDTFFDRINAFGLEHGIKVEHYIISRGHKEVIEASKYADKFDRIFASEYLYDETTGEPVWLRYSVNHTMKTQYIYRIRKNLIDKLYEDRELNEKADDTSNLLPLSHMVYFGDGYTDVPSMKTLTISGGHAICVYRDKTRSNADNLLNDGRVEYIAEADYSEGSKIDKICKTVIAQISLKN